MDAETQLAGYFARFEPAVAGLGVALRARLRGRLPGLTEVVYFYENQGSLVISYSPTGQGYEGLCSLALRAGQARLYFTRGGALAPDDTGKLLQGRGPGVRHIVLSTAADFDRPEVESLIAAALKLAKVRLNRNATGEVIRKAGARKQRRGRQNGWQPACAGLEWPATEAAMNKCLAITLLGFLMLGCAFNSATQPAREPDPPAAPQAIEPVAPKAPALNMVFDDPFGPRFSGRTRRALLERADMTRWEFDPDNPPVVQPRFVNVSVPDGSGAAPMPFGYSMFGPWDTGRPASTQLVLPLAPTRRR